MKPEYEGLMRTVTQWSRWEYKDKQYTIMTVTPGMLSQDAEIDEWCPTVIYTCYTDKVQVGKGETYVASMDLRFARPLTEFVRKFKKVEETVDSK